MWRLQVPETGEIRTGHASPPAARRRLGEKGSLQSWQRRDSSTHPPLWPRPGRCPVGSFPCGCCHKATDPGHRPPPGPPTVQATPGPPGEGAEGQSSETWLWTPYSGGSASADTKAPRPTPALGQLQGHLSPPGLRVLKLGRLTVTWNPLRALFTTRLTETPALPQSSRPTPDAEQRLRHPQSVTVHLLEEELGVRAWKPTQQHGHAAQRTPAWTPSQGAGTRRRGPEGAAALGAHETCMEHGSPWPREGTRPPQQRVLEECASSTTVSGLKMRMEGGKTHLQHLSPRGRRGPEPGPCSAPDHRPRDAGAWVGSPTPGLPTDRAPRRHLTRSSPDKEVIVPDPGATASGTSSGLPGPLTFPGSQSCCPPPRLTPRARGRPGGLPSPRCCWSLSEALDRELRLEDGREPPRSACASCRSCKSFVVSSKCRWPSSWSSSFFTFPVRTGQVSQPLPRAAASSSLVTTHARRTTPPGEAQEHKQGGRAGRHRRRGGREGRGVRDQGRQEAGATRA